MAVWNIKKGKWEETEEDKVWNIKESKWESRNNLTSIKPQDTNKTNANIIYKQKLDNYNNLQQNYLQSLSNSYKEQGVNFDNRNTFNKGQNASRDMISYTGKRYDRAKSTFNNDKDSIAKARENVPNESAQVERAKQEMFDALEKKYIEEVDNYKVTNFDKSIGRITGNITGSKTLNNGNEYVKRTDENGNVSYRKTKNELLQDKVRNSYNTWWGKLGGDVLETVTRIKSADLLNKATGGFGGSALYWSEMATDNYKNAVNQGADKEHALTYSLVGTAAEFLTGKALGTATHALTGGTSKEVSNFVANAVNNTVNKIAKNPKISNYISNFIGNATSEGLEEFIQEYVDKVNSNINIDKNPWDTNLFTQEQAENALYSGLIGSITGGVLGEKNKATLPTANSNNQTNINNTDGNPLINNNKVMLPKAPINTQNDINTNIINNNQVDILEQVPGMNQLKDNIQTNSDRFEYTKSDNPKIDNLRKSANLYFNNSIASKSFVGTAEKIISDKGYNVILDNSITSPNGNIVNAQIKTLDNGETEIRINPNSERAGEFLLMHEVTHAIETTDMKNLVIDYASKNEKFQGTLKSLQESYGTDDVSSEVIAEISSQLFGNQEFINNLSAKQPGIFKRIYNVIISIANKITGNSKESLFIRDLRNKWETAYSTRNNNLNNQKYHISANFSNEIDQVLNGNYDSQNQVKARDYTPKILVENGVNDLPMLMTTKHIKSTIYNQETAKNLGLPINKNINYHGLGKEVLIKVIDSLDNPSEIYKTSDDNYLIITEIKDSKGKNIVVPIKIDGKGTYNNLIIDENQIKSAYGKNNLENYLKNEKFQKIYEKKGNTLNERVQYPNISNSIDDNITQSNDNVKSPSTKHSIQKKEINTSKNNIEQNNNAWQKYLEENYKSKGTRTYFEDMRLDKNNIEQNLFEKEKIKTQQKYENNEKKFKKNLSKEAAKILEFSDRKSKENFKEIIAKHYENPDYTQLKEDITNSFQDKIKEYSTQKIEKIKKDITTTDFVTPEYLQHEITDFKQFNKEIVDKIHFDNNGITVEEYYQKMNEQYPDIFSNDASTEKEKFYKILDIMNSGNYDTDKYHSHEKAIEEATNYIYSSLEEKVSLDDLVDSIKVSPKAVRKEVMNNYRNDAKKFLKNSANFKDKKIGLLNKINTMERNFIDIAGTEDGERLIQEYILPIYEADQYKQQTITKYKECIKQYKLSDKESVAVQMWGEYKYNPETLLTGAQVDDYITINKLDHKKIEKAAEEARKIFDEVYELRNAAYREVGLKEIEYRKGYTPHFKDEHAETGVGKALETIGFKPKNNDIPTSIAGITEDFIPNKAWSSSTKQRKGKVTDYNINKALDIYLEEAFHDIAFLKPISKLRAFETEVRYEASDRGVQAEINNIREKDFLSYDEQQKAIEEILEKSNNPLNTFVTEIRDYTNGLTKKKSELDRVVEKELNRKIYNIMSNISNRISANMISLNVGSAITNFIPLTQAMGEVKPKYLLKGLVDSIKNQVKDDGFENRSVFLTTRLNQAENLHKTAIERFSDKFKLNIMFDGIDSITSNAIVRGKYYQNLEQGMAEYNAMLNADRFARGLMGGRSTGEMPTVFNSKNPFIKLFTTFQLETNNQFGYLFKDLPRHLADEGKEKLLAAFIKMFVGAWLYNQISEKVVGRKSAFSPIDTVGEILDVTTDKNRSIVEKTSSITKNIGQDIPFVGGVLGGGKLPISSAIPDLTKIGKSIDKLKDKEKDNNKEAWIDIRNEAFKPFLYVGLPFGGGQLKKIAEGASMYLGKKDIKGSYNSKGELKFKADESPAGVAQALLFGQNASKNAREYYDKGYAPLDKESLEEIKKWNVSVDEYRNYREHYRPLHDIKSDTNSEGKKINGSAAGKKAHVIMNSDYSDKEKNYLLSKITNSESPTKVKDLKKLDNDKKIYKYYYSLNQDGRKSFIKEIDNYDLSSKELYKYYSTIRQYKKDYTANKVKELTVSYIQNLNTTEKTKWYLYDKDYGSDTSKLLVKTFKINTNDYFNTMKYAEEIKEKYKGTKNSKFRKNQVFNYIENLNVPAATKIVLFRQAGYRTSKGKDSMYKFINESELSIADKKKIWKYLY